MSKVHWGIVSTANINRRVIPAIHASERGELVAVASRSQDSAAAYAAEWEIPQPFGSYQAMLDSDAVDTVYISLPNHLHAEWSIRALRAGKHVLCEKPIAITLAEIDAMIAAAQETGKVLAEAFMYRHHPQTKVVGEWVREGRLGQVTLLRATFNFAMRSRANIRLDPAKGGGSLWDVGVYPVSLAQFVLGGPPQSVVGDQWIGDSGVDENFAGQMHYGNGAVAQFGCAFRTPWMTRAEIIGTQGCLSLNRPFTNLDDERRLVFHPPQGAPEEVPVPQQDLYLGEVQDMHRAILEGTPTYVSLDESRNHVRTVLALYESAKTVRLVHL